MAVYGWQQADAGKSRLDAKFNDTILYSMDGTGISFYNQTPVARPSAYTQTYSTANKTHANRTAAALTDNSGGGDTPDGTIGEIVNINLSTSNTYTDSAVNGAVNAVVDDAANAIEECAAQINNLIADQADTAQIVNSIIDDLQALGLVQ